MDEVVVGLAGIEKREVTDEDELLAGTGDGDVEFAVDEFSLGVNRIGEDGKLPGGTDNGGEDDDVALRALITLYGVDGDGVCFGHVELGKGVAQLLYLTAEGHDDTEALLPIGRKGVVAAEVSKGGDDLCGLACFEAVALLPGFFGIADVEAEETTSGQGNV